MNKAKLQVVPILDKLYPEVLLFFISTTPNAASPHIIAIRNILFPISFPPFFVAYSHIIDAYSNFVNFFLLLTVTFMLTFRFIRCIVVARGGEYFDTR